MEWRSIVSGLSVALAGCGGLYLLAWYRQSALLATYWSPPGAVPVLGHGIQIGLSENPENPLMWMAAQSKNNEYKPWIARLLILDYMLVVSDAEMIAQILADAEAFPRSYHFDIDKILFGGDVLFALHGPVWKIHRKIMSPFFAISKQKSIFSIAKEVVIKATSILDNLCVTQEVFDLHTILTALTCDIICCFIFGESFGCLDGAWNSSLLQDVPLRGTFGAHRPFVFVPPASTAIPIYRGAEPGAPVL